ncbi:hypothetical protein Lalb_Chr01g0016421 [Lupinus albus]|uniref:Uncharacterized protein n=1 Tax=Lupinus albus TaxID=3870 RepID=A0A6A4R859_LUPAL|nr:hypothetical protein Lalb_Chr01g0016421 [Lupinus albus]
MPGLNLLLFAPLKPLPLILCLGSYVKNLVYRWEMIYHHDLRSN